MARRGFWMTVASFLSVAASADAQEQSTEVGEVVVTAAPYAVSLDSATTSVNVVSRAQIDTAVPAGIGDVLANLPGLRSTFNGPGASRPVIRGLSGPRVMVLQNGVGQVDASSVSPDHAVASDPEESSRIEVLRGPSALAYGGSAIGGVVNIIDDRIPSTPAAKGGEGRVSASAGSVDDSYAVSGAYKIGTGPLVFTLDGVRRESNDYDVPVNPVSDRLAASEGLTPSPDRKVLNADVELLAYGAGVSLIGENGFVGVSARTTDTSYGVPYEQVVGGPAGEGPVAIDLRQTRYDLRGEYALNLAGFDKVRLSVGRADYRHEERDVASGDIGTEFLSSGTEGRLELVQADHGGWKGAVGLQGLTRKFEAIGDEAFIPPVDIGEVGLFALQRLDKDRWGLEGGLRLDRRGLSADLVGRPTSEVAQSFGLDWTSADASPAFSNRSASAAAFVRPGQAWFASLSLSYNRRAPTEFELFADGPHGGTNAYEIGDPALKSEAVTSVEGTLRWQGGNGRLEGHLYYSDFNGFIDEAPTGLRADDTGQIVAVGGLPVIRFTQTGARFFGGELEGSYDLWRRAGDSLALEAALDFVRGDTDLGPPARTPPMSVEARLVWTTPHWSARGEIRRVAEQDRVAQFELPTEAYTLVNAQVAWRPHADGTVKLFLDGRNLTDQEAREHVSYLKDIAPLPGRNIRAGVALTF